MQALWSCQCYLAKWHSRSLKLALNGLSQNWSSPKEWYISPCCSTWAVFVDTSHLLTRWWDQILKTSGAQGLESIIDHGNLSKHSRGHDMTSGPGDSSQLLTYCLVSQAGPSHLREKAFTDCQKTVNAKRRWKATKPTKGLPENEWLWNEALQHMTWNTGAANSTFAKLRTSHIHGLAMSITRQ